MVVHKNGYSIEVHQAENFDELEYIARREVIKAKHT